MSLQAVLTRGQRRVAVSVNPATMEKLAEVELMAPEEIQGAVQRAAEAFPAWSARSAEERAALLRKVQAAIVERTDEIAETICREMGKPRFEAVVHDILTVVNLIDYYAQHGPRLLREEPIRMSLLFRAFKKSTIVRRPYGVVAVISPWNYPFAIPMSGILFALLAGNTVVFKPATEVVLVGRKIKEVFDAAGLPGGVLELVLASGRDVGDALFRPPVRKVVFTGSTAVGREVLKRSSEHIVPAVLELGGKDPMVVLDDADVELAASGAVWGAFTNCGQVCASIERCYVHESLYERFVNRVVEKTKALKLGPYTDPEAQVGPMVSPGQLQIVEEQVNDAVKRGAKVLAGGRNREDLGGLYYEPTVLVDVDHSMKVMREETFGPVLPVMKFKTDEEAVALANDTVYGLTASVWGRDPRRARRVAERIEAGTVCVNDHAYTYGAVETPWQGLKESGIGVSHSARGLHEFTQPVHINEPGGLMGGLARRSPTRPWFYPYTPRKADTFRTLTTTYFNPKVPRLVRVLKSLPKIPSLFK